MDPVTALGLACSVIQVVDFSTRTIKTAWEIWRSKSGASEENESIEARTEILKALLQSLRTPRGHIALSGVSLYSLLSSSFILFPLPNQQQYVP